MAKREQTVIGAEQEDIVPGGTILMRSGRVEWKASVLALLIVVVGCATGGASFADTPVTYKSSACPAEQANRLETEFLRSLEQTTRFEIHARTLRLYAGDHPTLVFTAE